jgi:hypothetical protein
MTTVMIFILAMGAAAFFISLSILIAPILFPREAAYFFADMLDSSEHIAQLSSEVAKLKKDSEYIDVNGIVERVFALDNKIEAIRDKPHPLAELEKIMDAESVLDRLMNLEIAIKKMQETPSQAIEQIPAAEINAPVKRTKKKEKPAIINADDNGEVF